MSKLAFVKKEFSQIVKTYKIYAVPCVFLFFGLSSPILAKMMPDLIKSMGESAAGLRVPTPTAKDAYVQLFKNLNQIGMLVVIFTSVGLVAEEKARGTAMLMLTKPLSRWSFVISKYLASATLIVSSTLIAYVASLYYTDLLFKEPLFVPSAQAILLATVYYLFILALTLLISTVAKSIAVAGGVSAIGAILLSLLPSLHKSLAHYSPGALTNYEGRLISGASQFSDALPALAVTTGFILAFILGSSAIFQRQEL